MAWKKPVLVTADIAAENTYSDPLFLRGPYNFKLGGTFSATVNLQKSYANPAGTANWDNVADTFGVEDFTGPTQMIGDEPEGAWYRFGVATGDYSSGTVSGRLSQ